MSLCRSKLGDNKLFARIFNGDAIITASNNRALIDDRASGTAARA
jgi:hypothetical protein